MRDVGPGESELAVPRAWLDPTVAEVLLVSATDYNEVAGIASPGDRQLGRVVGRHLFLVVPVRATSPRQPDSGSGAQVDKHDAEADGGLRHPGEDDEADGRLIG